MKPASPARGRLSDDAIRDELSRLGLHEEEKPIAGYAFTFYKDLDRAMLFYQETHGGVEARRFYIAQRMFILAH